MPKTLPENLAFRKLCIELGALSKDWQALLWKLCKEDLLFYVNTFTYTYDNRDPKNRYPVIPFITWPFQDKAFARIEDAIGSEDLVIDKTRDMGASWMCLTTFQHQWQFYDGVSFLAISRVEDLVDKPGDPKSLFWKVDLLLEWQPGWLLPEMKRSAFHFENIETGATFDGESTTGSAGRGDRRTAMLLDEFADTEPKGMEIRAASSATTKCRIFNSTHQGTATTFYEMCRKGSPIYCPNRLELDWWHHPEKNKGYYLKNGKPRSIWYDAMASKMHPKELAQEVDRDPQGSQWQFFEQEVLDEHDRLFAKTPFHVGRLDYDSETCEPEGFIEDAHGKLKLWLHPDAKGQIRQDLHYGAGVDISWGQGASNSAICGGNRKTAEKLFEYIDPHIKPEELARLSIAMCRWAKGADAPAGGAYLIWEANGGPGNAYSKEIQERGYRHVYMRKDEDKLGAQAQGKMGWWAAGSSKAALISDYREAMKLGQLVERSIETLMEARQFVNTPDNKVEHSKAKNSYDPSGAGDNHGDSVIASALFWHACKNLRSEKVDQNPVPVMGSFAYRREERLRESRRPKYRY